MEFVDDDQDQASIVNGDSELNVLAYLLGTEPRHVQKALCYRVVAAAGSEVLDKGHHAKDASHGRDALAKVDCIVPWKVNGNSKGEGVGKSKRF